jgi:hypothetical protein
MTAGAKLLTSSQCHKCTISHACQGGAFAIFAIVVENQGMQVYERSDLGMQVRTCEAGPSQCSTSSQQPFSTLTTPPVCNGTAAQAQ